MSLQKLILLAVVFSYTSNADRITWLPGAPPYSFIKPAQYSGYFDVGEGNHLFYWFIESANDPANDPVLLWLNGGPGCSSLEGVLTEWGPLLFEPTSGSDGAKLNINPYAWNRNASILALESPAGVGFSYSDSGDVSTDDNKTAIENWEALKAFYTEFPQFRKNDFYVTGESYAGIYVPTLVQTILVRQLEFEINLKGFAIGNGWVSHIEDVDSLIQFLYNHGTIDDGLWQQVKSECCGGEADDCAFHKFYNETAFNVTCNFCESFVDTYYNSVWGKSYMDTYNMYDDCEQPPDNQTLHCKQNTSQPVTREFPKLMGGACTNYTALTEYLNRTDVREALLGLIPSFYAPTWQMCSSLVSDNYTMTVTETAQYFKNALNVGLRVLLYNGDVDLACNFLSAQRFARELGYKVLSNGTRKHFQKTKAKTGYEVDGLLGGYHTKYDNLDFVTIRGSGHMVPKDKPAVAIHVIDAFLNDRDP